MKMSFEDWIVDFVGRDTYYYNTTFREQKYIIHPLSWQIWYSKQFQLFKKKVI